MQSPIRHHEPNLTLLRPPAVLQSPDKRRREEKHPGGRGWAGRRARPPPATVRECRCILLLYRHLDDGLFVSSHRVMDNHIGKQMQQAILRHNRRDSDVLKWGQHNTRASKRVLLHQRRELCQSNSGTICSGFLCFIVLADFYRGRPLEAQTTRKERDCVSSPIPFTLPDKMG